MTDEALPAITALNRRFLLDYPHEAARRLESMSAEDAAALLAAQPVHAAVRAWQALGSDAARSVLETVPEALAKQLLTDSEPIASAAVLAQVEPEEREAWLRALDPQIAQELRQLLEYSDDSAGRLMDARVTPLRAGLTVAEALARLRTVKRQGLRELFVVDDEGRLTGRVEIQDLAVADETQPLREITHGLIAVVQDLDPREDVVNVLQQQPITELPVVTSEGRFVGVIRQAALVSAIEQETSADIQTMVGASPDERALSSPGFAVIKRLPWLQINLLTAFLAAAVVGLFESTIAKFTALAVLLPVVAGQSGNAGAQALAVTMRGLFLREISLRHWPRVVFKEAAVGLANGIAVAFTTALGVYFWSRSTGLVVVISTSMVISMVIAGIAGALVPIMLRRFGQDPAQSSSIVLTTVTDVAGFFSFLGIATLLAGLLEKTT
ncbi:MAG: magnesium transporter [Betaproteobacteria bacterium]|jgi:magnesium transporter|nr:magnesium transporter [Betaproteobacteria bacterium]